MLQAVWNGVASGSLLALATSGLFLIYWTTKHFHIAYGATFTASSYAAYVAAQLLPLPIAIGIGALAGALIGMALYRGVYTGVPTRMGVLLASFGVSVVITNALFVAFGTQAHVVHTPRTRVSLFAVTTTTLQLIFIAVSCLALTTLWLILNRTGLGLRIRAVAADPDIAEYSGVFVRRTMTATYGLGSFLGGIAASLSMLDTGAYPFRGEQIVLLMFLAVFLAGGKSLWGGVIAALLFEVLLSLGGFLLSGGVQQIALYALILALLLARPAGLVGANRREKKVEMAV